MQTDYTQGSIIESPVGLVLVNAPNRTNAMTVSFFSEVAHHPATLWVSIAKSSYTHELLEETGQFSLAVLHERQGEIARACGTVSGRRKNKCAELDVYSNAAGFLYLRDALANSACRVRSTHDVGDHTLYIADILEGELESRNTIRRQLLVSDL